MTNIRPSLPPVSPDEHCPDHGRILHALVHEAGHVVVGNRHDIAYDTVSVPRDLGPVDPKFGASVGGGLDMGRVPEAWVPMDPVRSLEMLLAGRAAELHLLGHDLPESAAGDAMVWAWGMRAHPDVAEGGGLQAGLGALGEPLRSIFKRALEIVEMHDVQVIAIANAIYASSDWTLTNTEAVALL